MFIRQFYPIYLLYSDDQCRLCWDRHRSISYKGLPSSMCNASYFAFLLI